MKSQASTNLHEPRPSGLVVELARAGDDDQFTCTLTDWNFIRELGKTFGWRPAGTIYLPQQGERARHNQIKHDYQPGDSRDTKRVEAGDSAQWAAALETAQRSPFISSMLRAHARLLNRNHADAEHSLRSQLQAFIQFARRGAFTVALKDMQ
jgi:hypothetical protein